MNSESHMAGLNIACPHSDNERLSTCGRLRLRLLRGVGRLGGEEEKEEGEGGMTVWGSGPV